MTIRHEEGPWKDVEKVVLAHPVGSRFQLVLVDLPHPSLPIFEIMWVELDPGRFLRQCPVCLSMFEADRENATTCSDRCRQRRYRLGQKLRAAELESARPLADALEDLGLS